MARVFATILQPSKKIVLLALADFANDDGKNIFPSVATIAKKSSLSRRSVQMILADFVSSGVLRVAKNGLGGAPGSTRHLIIDLTVLENMVRIAREENLAPVSQRGAKERTAGAQTNEETGETPAPNPSVIHHQITTVESPNSSGGAIDEFEWPPQLDAEERDAVQTVLSCITSSNRQKQFVLDELRAALAKREIPRKAAWVRTVLARGIERTPAGKAFDRSRKERKEHEKPQHQKTSGLKTEAQKDADRARLRSIKESLKK